MILEDKEMRRVARQVAVEALLNSIVGENSQREGLVETPMRVCKMYDEIFGGYQMNPNEILSKTFKDENHREMVIVKDIEFYSHCEHHMVPFFGVAHVGYIPSGTLVGISKIARLVECFAKRLQVQERLTSQIADELFLALQPMGVAVVIEAQHLCFDKETEVLTENGWKFFKDLQEGEKVAQVNIETNEFSFTIPTDYISYRYKGKMHLFQSSNSIDQCITPDHRVVGLSEWDYYHTRKSWQVKSAAEWTTNYRFAIPRKCVREKYLEDASDYMLGKVKVTQEQYAKFMGIWLAEGCTLPDYKTVISQNTGEVAIQIEELLLEIGITYYTGYTMTGCIQFIMSDRALAEQLKSFGKSCNKKEDREIRKFTHQNIETFLHWFWLGDGSTDPNTGVKQYHSSSIELISFIQELIIYLGNTGNLCTYAFGGKDRYIIREAKKNAAIVGPEHRSLLDYDDFVYCVSVPTGALIIRRNGIPSISGNCMSMRGIKKPTAKTLTSAMRGVFLDNDNVARNEFLTLIK